MHSPLEQLEPRRLLAAMTSGLVVNSAPLFDSFAPVTAVAPQSVAGSVDASRIGVPLAAGLAPMTPGLAPSAVSSPATSSKKPPAPPPLPQPDPALQIKGFTLLDAATERPLRSSSLLVNGATLNLATLGTRTLNIQATVSTKPKSVIFTIDGVVRADDLAPFTAEPLRADHNYAIWTPAAGIHTLTATAFTGLDGKGTAGATQTITFNVIDATYPGRPAPLPGGTRYVVDRAGSIKTVGQAAALAHAGDVVLIAPGVYHESLSLVNSGTADRPITFAPITPGTVTLDGTGFGYILRGAVSDIHLQELTFDHAANTVQSAAVEVSSRWQLTDCTIQNTDGQGLVVYGDGAVLTRVTAQYNGEEGISGSNCSNVLLTNCITRYNNNGKANPVWKNDSHAVLIDGLYYVDTSWQAGAGKWVRTDGVTLDGMQSYGNHGTGIWFDYNNTNVVVRNSDVHDNTPVTASNFWEGVGISIELCTGPVLLQNNSVYNQIGGDIVIASSRGVTATGNTLTGGYIALTDWDRGADYTLLDLNFHDNIFNDVFIWTGSDNWDESSGVTKNIQFDFDTWNYHTTQLAIWAGVSYYTPDDMRQLLGLEANGTFTQL